MTRSQKTYLWVLGFMVIAVFGGLLYFVGQDLITYQVDPLITAIRARATPPQPTIIWVYPTDTPVPASTATATPEAGHRLRAELQVCRRARNARSAA